MAIAVDASSPAAVSNDTNTATTASFTPAASSLLVALVTLGNTGASLVNGTVTDSLASTWTLLRRYRSAATSGTLEIWVQDIGASPSARTVTITGSVAAAKGCSLVVQCLTGARAYNSGNGQCLGQQSQSGTGTSAALSITALGAGSLTYYLAAYDTSTTFTVRSDNTALVNYADATNTATFFVSRLTATSTQAASVTGGTTTTGLTAGSLVNLVIEFVAADSTLKNTRINLSPGSISGLTSTGGDAVRLAGLAIRAEYQPNICTYFHKRTVAGPTSALQVTDASSVATADIADGTALSFYTLPLKAVTIAGQITMTIYARESTTGNAVAVTCSLDRCANDGSVISNIFGPTTTGMAATGGELSTAVGGAAKSFTITAANVPDTTLVNGDRLRVRVHFDDAGDFGGTGNMQGSSWAQLATWPPQAGSSGDSRISFTENLEEYVLVGSAQALAGSSAGTGTAGATVLGLAPALAGQADGTGTATGSLVAAVSLTGATGGTATASGSLVASVGLVGASGGTATATASLAVAKGLTGATGGLAGATGDLAVAHSLAGTSSGTGGATGTAAGSGVMAGQADGSGTATGSLGVARPLSGASGGTGTAGAGLVASVGLAGASGGTSTAAGSMAVARSLAGASAGASGANASVSLALSLAATSAGQGDAAGTLTAAHISNIPLPVKDRTRTIIRSSPARAKRSSIGRTRKRRTS